MKMHPMFLRYTGMIVGVICFFLIMIFATLHLWGLALIPFVIGTALVCKG